MTHTTDVPAEREMRGRIEARIAELDESHDFDEPYDGAGYCVCDDCQKEQPLLRDMLAFLAAPQESRAPARCQAVNFPRSMQCRLPARHGGEHIAGAGEGETRWTTEVADRLDASLAAARPAPETEREPDGWLPSRTAQELVCAHCGNPAACIGSYEGHPIQPACNDCCGHGEEDGWCVLLGAPAPAASVKVLEALYDTANDALVTRDVWVERAMRALRLGVYAEATERSGS